MSPFATRSLDDPEARQVIAALEAVGAGRSAVAMPRMTDSFRADLRAQLVAVTPRLVAEGVRPGTETAPATGRAVRAARGADAPAARPPVRTRPMTVLLAGAAVVVLGLGGATWLARGALPGDALYGLKRTAEGVDVSLSGSDLDKGHALLVDAQHRVDEVNQLLGRPQALASGTGYSAAGGMSDSTVRLVVSTLRAADDDTHDGVTRIGDDALTRGDSSGLQLVVAWAQGQRDRIDALVARIPSGAAHEQAATSAAEIRTGLQRATDLLADYTNTSCHRSRDDFGPTPCLTSPAPSGPSGGTTSAPSTGSGGSGSGGGGSSGASGATPAPTTSSAPTPTASSPLGTGTVGGTASLPVTPPVTVDSCGVQVSLPVAGVSLGTCAPR